jgi:hypothetical protein
MDLRSGRRTHSTRGEEEVFQDARDYVEADLEAKEDGQIGSKVRIEIFSCRKNIDPKEWMTKFLFLAGIFKWTDEQVITNVVFYLEEKMGDWVKKLIKEKKIFDVKSLEKQFLAFVVPPSYTTRKRIELENLKYDQRNNVIDYFLEVEKLCNYVDTEMSNDSKVHHALRGLPRELTDGLLARRFDNLDHLRDEVRLKSEEIELRKLFYPKDGSYNRTTSELPGKDNDPRSETGHPRRAENGFYRRPTLEVPYDGNGIDQRYRTGDGNDRRPKNETAWREDSNRQSGEGFSRRTGDGVYRRPLSEVTCWSCFEKGHTSFKCPQRVQIPEKNGQSPANH